jgi:predicted nucleotidyltransferase
VLEGIFGSTAKVRILRVLYARPQRERTIRDVARALDLSVGTVHPAVGQLAAARVILTHRVGRSVAVQANSSHPLFPALSALFRAETTAFATVAKAFTESLPANGLCGVVLYGSVARGEAGPRSDIDVLVVVDARRRAPAVQKAAAAVLDRFDANVVPLILTQGEVDRRLRAFDPLLLTIAKEGRRLRGRAPWLGP